MSIQLDITPDRWAALVSNFATEKDDASNDIGTITTLNGRKVIQINGRNLDEKQMLTLSQNQVTQNLTESAINKLIKAFSLFVNHQQTLKNREIIPALRSFSARFSTWANNHTTLAKIFSYLTFGLLFKFWIAGDKIHQNAKHIDAIITGFQDLVFHLANTSRPENEATAFPQVINDIIVEYLDEWDKGTVVSWKPLKPVLKRSYKFSFKIIKDYQTSLIPLLNPHLFADEIKGLKSLKSFLLEDHDLYFKHFIASSSRIEDAIQKRIVSEVLDSDFSWNEELSDKVLNLFKIKEFALLAVRNINKIYPLLPDHLKSDREIIFAALHKEPVNFKFLPQSLQNDRNFVLEVMQKFGVCYQHIPNIFQSDQELAIAAAIQNIGEVIGHLPPQLRTDKALFLEAVKRNGGALHFVPDQLKFDRDIVIAAVTQDGTALRHAGIFAADREIVLIALKQNGAAYEFVAENLKSDEDVILTAVSANRNTGAFKLIPKKFQNQKNIALAAVSNDATALEFVSKELQQDFEVVLASVNNYGLSLRYAHKALYLDPNIVLAALKQDGKVLQFGNEDLKSNRNLVLIAVRNYGCALQWASAHLRSDIEIVQAAVKEDGKAYQWTTLNNNKEIALISFKDWGESLQYASEGLKDDEDVVLTAVTQSGLALEHASKRLKNNKKIVLAALRENPLAIDWVSPELKVDPEVINQLE